MSHCVVLCTTTQAKLLCCSIKLSPLGVPNDQPSRAPRALVPHEENRTQATEDVKRSTQLTNKPAGICQGHETARKNNSTMLALRLSVRPLRFAVDAVLPRTPNLLLFPSTCRTRHSSLYAPLHYSYNYNNDYYYFHYHLYHGVRVPHRRFGQKPDSPKGHGHKPYEVIRYLSGECASPGTRAGRPGVQGWSREGMVKEGAFQCQNHFTPIAPVNSLPIDFTKEARRERLPQQDAIGLDQLVTAHG